MLCANRVELHIFIFQIPQILTDDVGPVLKLDAKLSSHPIIQTVNHPDEITSIFDTISYSKVQWFNSLTR